ncbi:MAG: NAD(P)-binding domain-containing protein [bacterium]
MKIGIIGAGRIGGTLAALFSGCGHEIAVSNSRGPQTLKDLTGELGDKAHAATPVEAAEFGELYVVSIPLRHYRDVPVRQLAGKIVIDTNNYYPERDGHFEELDADRTTSSELLQAHLPDSRVVKAFNTNYWHVLRDRGRPAGAPDRVGIPIAGDAEEAKRTVAALIDEIGFEAVDVGNLGEGRRFQPGSPVYAQAFTAREIRGHLEIEEPVI